jgi:hypothetical protein
MKKTAKKTVKNGASGRKHLGLHLQLTAEENEALEAVIRKEQEKVGLAKISVSSYVLGLLRKALQASKGR